MIAACPYCGGRARWYMTSYADGIDRPTDYYRCRECGKPFSFPRAGEEIIPTK